MTSSVGPAVGRQVAPQLGAHLDPRPRVERSHRLVEQEQPRVGREGARERDPLSLPARQPPRTPPRERLEPEPGQPLVGPGAGAAPADAATRAAYATLSRTDRCGNSRWSWKTTPMPRRSGGTKTPSCGLSSTTCAPSSLPSPG